MMTENTFLGIYTSAKPQIYNEIIRSRAHYESFFTVF